MATSEEDIRNSFTGLLFRTKQGQMILAMGILYTLTVSVSMGVLYFAVGPYLTLIALCCYILLTGALVYFRTPKANLIPPAFLVFTVLPVIASGLVIGVSLLLF